MFLNIGNLENQRYWFGTQNVKLHPNKPPTFLLLYPITNEKPVKLMQLNRLLSASKTSPQKHVPMTLVGIPYLIKSHIPCLRPSADI